MTDKRLLTIGEVLVEIVATTKGDGFRAAQPLIGPFPSGAPAIFVDQAARIGAEAAIISRVGADDFGKVNLDRLAADGVDISGIAVADDGAPTGSAFVRYRGDGSRAFVFNIAHSACGQLELTREAEAVIERCSHIHVMGTALSAPGLSHLIKAAIVRIKGQGGTLSFDPNLRPEILDTPGLRSALGEILAQTDVFLPSGDEIFLFTEAQDEAGAVKDLLARGIPEIVLKRGAKGASHFCAAGRTDVAPLAVEEIDPTGAGDCFGGAFVGMWLMGHPVEEALAYANAAGAHAVTRVGPMEGTATRAELDQFMKDRTR
ncbi:sugar/nucleoside kinase (ribokinase family) [Breoghania corrubedonensis]|uniref:Sugar/nucleoside kinase (Ribokinase family) n=1 Tax=Breoghania corrubedonensis TaxID=665038 RepID=A0A2T5VA25_9HYPH|nr:sugar kinase [Breoghania corrubedonensis]PTW60607.1 sugar/nucleoside kinase (ribokinase family) [Breoghania corrubedonensis]